MIAPKLIKEHTAISLHNSTDYGPKIGKRKQLTNGQKNKEKKHKILYVIEVSTLKH